MEKIFPTLSNEEMEKQHIGQHINLQEVLILKVIPGWELPLLQLELRLKI